MAESPGLSPSPALPSPILGFGPGLDFLQARARSSRAQARAFEPGPSPHITNYQCHDFQMLPDGLVTAL